MTTRRSAIDLWTQLDAQATAVAHIPPLPGWVYPSPEHFLLEHGQWYEVGDRPTHIPLGAPRMCYGNALLLATIHDLQYAEGVALLPSARLLLPHAWVIDRTGRAIEVTTPFAWSAYFGMPFSLERADDASWWGDGCILQDSKRGHPLLTQRWTGERPVQGYRPSPPLIETLRLLATGYVFGTEVAPQGATRG